MILAAVLTVMAIDALIAWCAVRAGALADRAEYDHEGEIA